MNFRQILVNHYPIDSKNKLNDLLADVERNFGVFSIDMELDIRTSITSDTVVDYFDRIIHEEHPKLEYDNAPDYNKSKKASDEDNQKKDIIQKEIERNRKLKTEKNQRQKAGKNSSTEKPVVRLSFISVRKKSDVDKIVDFFKVYKFNLTPAADKWLQFNISDGSLYIYYKDKMSAAFYNYKFITRKAKKIYLHELSAGKLRELGNLRHQLEEYINNDGQLLKQKKAPKENRSFEVLNKKEWVLDWNCVMFKRGSVVIYARSDLGFKFTPTTVYVKEALESFNYLKKYLNERLPPVRCSIKGLNLTVIDKINFNSAIQQFAVAARQGAIKTGGRSMSNGGSPMPMSFSQAMSKAKQMTIEEFKKYKSKYIDYLVSLQSDNYKVIPCVERLAHSNSDNMEYAFMFSVECNSGDILIVHENVNPDRSTLLFLVKEENYNRSIREIYDFLQSAEINKRSSLREKSLEIKNAGIVSYRSINHDDLYSWKSSISTYKKYR